jgi:hypothetical protein
MRRRRHDYVLDRLERPGKAVRDTETAGSALVMYVGSLTDQEVTAEAESHDQGAAAELSALPTS